MRRSPAHGNGHCTAARFRQRGGVELGEEPRAALQRKVREELHVAATQSGTLEPTAAPFSRTFTSRATSSDT
ncbi:NUDIX domain-containing protein [Curtobacterium citreum]|uniref:NUDIX domain-containing protein n=1 Tax=Curtobacterium citreum TaxID=2036 RepID=UPI003D756257